MVGVDGIDRQYRIQLEPSRSGLQDGFRIYPQVDDVYNYLHRDNILIGTYEFLIQAGVVYFDNELDATAFRLRFNCK